MNEEKKTNSASLKTLILGIALAVLGIAMIVVAVIVDQNLRQSPFAKSAWYIYFLEIVGAAVVLVAGFNLRHYFAIKLNYPKMNVKQMGVISIFGSLSVILYYFAKFNLPFFPGFLDIQFSDVPALITTFMYGPWSGAMVILVRFFCKLPGTMTAGVGELADLLIGLSLVLVSGFIYKKHRSFKGALCSLAFGMLFATFIATVSNWLILIPAYINITGMSVEAIMGQMAYLSNILTEENFMSVYLFVAVVPFNLFRYVLVFTITILLYKRLSMLIEHFTGDYMKDNQIEEDTENKTTETFVNENN